MVNAAIIYWTNKMEKDTNPKDAIGTAKWRQFFCVPMQVLWEVGVGMLEGTLKYGRHNYRGAGVRASVYIDAAMGHIQSWVEGEDVDKDSDLSHITKAICSLFVLRDAMMNDMWVDDRPPKIKDLDALRDRLQGIVDKNFERYADKDPHHYSEAEDGSPYRAEADTKGPVVNVVNGGGISMAELAHTLMSYPDRSVEIESARVGDVEQTTMSVGRAFRAEEVSGCLSDDDPMCEVDATREDIDVVIDTAGVGRAIREGIDAMKADEAEAAVQEKAANAAFGSSRKGPSLEECVAFLEDPRYWPRDPLACLSDDDPEQILWIRPDHAGYGTQQVVEGLTTKQFNRLVAAESELCVPGRVAVEFEPLARRVMLRLKGGAIVLLTADGECRFA